MTKLNTSIDRHSFQKFKYLERKAQEGKTPENDDSVKAYVDLFDFERDERKLRENSKDWQENNMEYDLRSTAWICDKVKNSDDYAQNLYAAMCNRSFQRNDMMPILKDQRWNCSWRYAGGIVADMREQGDYIDWYCSGIRGSHDLGGGSTGDHPNWVSEGNITEEIRSDLKKLGWLVIEGDND